MYPRVTFHTEQFESSYQRVIESACEDRADLFFERFYKRFTSEPLVRKLFANTEPQRQVRMLKRSVYDLVGFYLTGRPSAELERLADLHRDLRIPANLLDLWLSTLLDTVAELDPEFDEATKLSWACALLPGVTLVRLRLID